MYETFSDRILLFHHHCDGFNNFTALSVVVLLQYTSPFVKQRTVRPEAPPDRNAAEAGSKPGSKFYF